MMQLEVYFQFLEPDDIRLKGSRIGIESILYEYIYREQTPKEIAERFPSLSLEQIYATLLYYHHNKEAIDRYVADWMNYCLKTQLEHERNPSPAVLRLRQLLAEKDRLKAMELVRSTNPFEEPEASD